MIRLLESTVVDQIAAGEVVERPASVVKELVENALDAGATSIEVTLRDGGCSLVRVADDGSGMGRADALMCIERHATSKIRSVDDLRGVRTLGFRGEALPSIAAVSAFQLTTRTRGDDAGTRIRIDHGVLRDVRDAGAAPGTVVEARDLFRTLPARREFLRSPATELSHAVEAVSRVALVHPEVAFLVKHGDRVALRAPRVSDLVARAVDILGPDARDAVTIEVDGEPVAVRGWLAPLSAHRAGVAQGVHLYVGGRWIRDRIVRAAVAAAFRDRLPPGRHPLLMLDLEVPDGGVDVNVHPTKSEVRFRDPGRTSTRITEILAQRSAPRAVHRTAGASPDLPLFAPSPPTRISALPDDLPPPPARELPLEPLPVPVPLAAEPSPSPGQRVVGLVHRRHVVVEEPGRIVVIDGGRALRRIAARDAAPGGPRLLVPARVTVGAASVRLAVERSDELEALGLSVIRLSVTELVVRAVPSTLADAGPGLVVTLCLAALAAGDDPREVLGERLPPLLVGADAVARVLEEGGPVVGVVPLPG